MTARDWLEEAPKSQQEPPRDWLQGPEPETFGQAILQAPFRIAEDVAGGANNLLQNASGYFEKYKTELPGFWSNLVKHPGSMGMQGLAGANELINQINQAPVGIANYGANRLNLLPKVAPGFVKKFVPEDTTEAINQLFSQPQYEGEALFRGLVRNAPGIGAGAKTASALNPLNLTTKSIAKDVLNTRQKNIEKYGNRYNKFWKESEGKGFSDALYNIDVDMKTIKKYSPGKGIQGLLDFNMSPTLQNAHNAKSDLLRIKRDLDKLTTLRTAERQQLGAVNNAIDSINNNMFKGPDGKIHEGMKKKYDEIQEGYKNEVVPYKNKAINEFMRNESSADELVNSLSKKAFYAKRGKNHPAMRIRNSLPKTIKGLGPVGVAAWAANKFFNENK